MSKVQTCPPPPKVKATPIPDDAIASLRSIRPGPQDLQRFGYDITINSARPFSVDEPVKITDRMALATMHPEPGGWVTAMIIDLRAGAIVGYGIARCNPTDEWDDQRGFEIAYGRAYRQAFGR